MDVKCLEMPDGFTMVYRTGGNSESPPLLICHGLGGNHIQFAEDLRHFARNRFVILPDMRGHGDTTAPPMPTSKDFTCEKFASDLIFLLDHLGIERVDVIGNSLGGDIGLELIKLKPRLVRSLMTFGTTYQLKIPKVMLFFRNAVYFFLGKRFARWAANQTSGTPKGRQIMTRVFSRAQAKTAKLVGPNICKFDYRPVVESFEGPILLLQCKNDHSINRVLKPTLETLKKKKSAEVQWFENGGHCANVDDPEEFRKRVDAFLASLDK